MYKIERYNKPPKVLMWLLIVFFAATPCDYALPRFNGATILYVLGMLICAVTAIDLLFGGNKKMFLSTDNALIVLLCFLAAMSLIWAEDFNRGSSRLTSFAAIVFMYTFLFFYEFTLEEVKQIEIASIIGGTIMVLYVFTKVDLDMVMAGYRLDLYRLVGGGYSDPNGLASRLMMPLIFCFKYIFESKKKLVKLLLIAALALIVYVVFLTGSRAAVLALAAIVFTILMKNMTGKRKTTVLTIIFAAFVAIIVFPDLIPAHLYNRIFNFESYEAVLSTDGDRLGIWKNVFTRVFPNSPIFGYGIGNGPVAMKSVYDRVVAIHNAFFVYLVELGLFGFILWIAFVISKVKTAMKIQKKYMYPFIVMLGTLIMAFTLNAEIEKYLWNSFLYVHMVSVLYSKETEQKI